MLKGKVLILGKQAFSLSWLWRDVSFQLNMPVSGAYSVLWIYLSHIYQRIHDALLTRLSNDDDIERGLSTFANEMSSSAMILGSMVIMWASARTFTDLRQDSLRKIHWFLSTSWGVEHPREKELVYRMLLLKNWFVSRWNICVWAMSFAINFIWSALFFSRRKELYLYFDKIK